jgi:hypothetical protein
MKNAMRGAIALGIVLMVVLAINALQGGRSAAKAAPTQPASIPEASAKIIIYYFHGPARCVTCRKIEAYSEEAVKSVFSAELKQGAMAWQVLNVFEPANSHFLLDFQLHTSSLVVVDGSNAKRFKNLDQVWTLVAQKEVFVKYVLDEIRAFRDR